MEAGGVGAGQGGCHCQGWSATTAAGGRHLSSPIRIGDGHHDLRSKFMCMRLKKNILLAEAPKSRYFSEEPSFCFDLNHFSSEERNGPGQLSARFNHELAGDGAVYECTEYTPSVPK